MMMRLLLLLVICLIALPGQATVWSLWPLEQRWPEVDIVAIVTIGAVHEHTTPEGVTIQSAEATVEEEMYRRFPSLDGDGKKIRLYVVMPNGPENFSLAITSGRAFVMMKANGLNAFNPVDPWANQPFDGRSLRWPESTGVVERSIEYVREQVRKQAAAEKTRKSEH